MRLAFRPAARKRQRGPLTSPQRKRYKQTDSPVHRMLNTTNLFNLRVVISTWIIQDKLSRAYQALTGDIGERMPRILKLGTTAEGASKCLACPALIPPP